MALPTLDKYLITKEIGHKICFTLYEAVEKRTGEPVHLKLLESGLNSNDSQIANFLGAIRIVRHLNHPNICQILDVGQDTKTGQHFVTSEPHQLETLRALILDEFSLSLEDLTDIFSVIGKTLRNAHLHGLVHGFLSPDAIYVKPDGGIKIDDLGFSWYIPTLLTKVDRQTLDLAQYIAPEFHNQIESIDGRSDIYSVGLILHHLLRGKPAYAAETMDAIKRLHQKGELPALSLQSMGLPDELADFVRTAAQSNRELRFQNVKEYLQALEAVSKPHLPGGDTMVANSDVEIAFAPQQSDKYFADEDTDVTYDPPKFDFDFKPTTTLISNINKKYLLSGAGAVFLVVLILFVTNYIPWPFIERPDESGLTDLQVTTEVTTPETPVAAKKTDGAGTEKSTTSQIYDDIAKSAPPVDGLLAAETSRNSASGNSKATTQPARTETKPVEKPAVTKPEPVKQPPVKQPEPERKAADKPVTKPENQPAPATTVNLLVQSDRIPVDASIFLDNKFVGKASSNGTLALPKLDINRNYAVRVSKEGYVTANKTIHVTESTPRVVFDLEAEVKDFGTLLVDAIPQADEIYIDNALHNSPSPARLSLKSGKHTIKLVNKRLKATHEETIDLRVGQVLRVKHDFTAEEVGKVAISLKNAAQYGFGYVYVDGKIWHDKHNTTPLEIELPVGSHTIEVRREGFNTVPKDVIVTVDKTETKYVAFTFMKTQ